MCMAPPSNKKSSLFSFLKRYERQGKYSIHSSCCCLAVFQWSAHLANQHAQFSRACDWLGIVFVLCQNGELWEQATYINFSVWWQYELLWMRIKCTYTLTLWNVKILTPFHLVVSVYAAYFDDLRVRITFHVRLIIFTRGHSLPPNCCIKKCANYFVYCCKNLLIFVHFCKKSADSWGCP